MKRVTVIAFLLIFICVFTGCQGYREIDSEYLISAIAFDKKEDSFLVYAEVLSINPEKKDTKSKVFSALGKTPYEAVGNISFELPRTAVFDHCGTAIIGKKIKGDDLKTVFKYLYDTKNLNLGIYVFLSSDVKNLLACEPQSISVGYDIMAVISNIQKTSGISFKNKYYEIESRIISTGGFCLPDFENKNDRPTVAGQVVFVDYYPQITLSENETVFYNLLFSGSTGGAISVSGKRCRVNSISTDLTKTDNGLTVKIGCKFRNKDDNMNKEIKESIKNLLNKLKGTKALAPLGISGSIDKISVEVKGNGKR